MCSLRKPGLFTSKTGRLEAMSLGLIGTFKTPVQVWFSFIVDLFFFPYGGLLSAVKIHDVAAQSP